MCGPPSNILRGHDSTVGKSQPAPLLNVTSILSHFRPKVKSGGELYGLAQEALRLIQNRDWEPKEFHELGESFSAVNNFLYRWRKKHRKVEKTL